MRIAISVESKNRCNHRAEKPAMLIPKNEVLTRLVAKPMGREFRK